MSAISVVIPVGPEKHHADYLSECIDSVFEQTDRPEEIVIIDDMHGLHEDFGENLGLPRPVRVWRSPWRLGVAHAFNFGVALARYNSVFLLGADDKLLPTCLEKCWKKYEQCRFVDGYYFVPVVYSDGRGEQNLPCGAAMVTKELWRKTGGFPTESASGASDAAFISMAMASDMQKVCPVYKVEETDPLYWYRVHENTDTSNRGPWQGVILETRNLVTLQWQPPQWGRYKI